MPQVSPSKYLVMAGWDDAPHLDAKTKRELLDSTPAHLRDARSKGIPTLGSGAIFPISEDTIRIDPIVIPPHWPRINGMDFGWDHPTAASCNAWDRDTDTWYVTAGFRKSGVSGQALPPVVASGIKAWGEWIPTAWPHDGHRHELNGQPVADIYTKEGLHMLREKATHEGGGNSVEAGLLDMLERMQTGRFKVFSTVDCWWDEFRLYHRADGKIVKQFDDFISSVRYGLMMKRKAKVRPVPRASVVSPFRPLDPTMGY